MDAELSATLTIRSFFFFFFSVDSDSSPRTPNADVDDSGEPATSRLDPDPFWIAAYVMPPLPPVTSASLLMLGASESVSVMATLSNDALPGAVPLLRSGCWSSVTDACRLDSDSVTVSAFITSSMSEPPKLRLNESCDEEKENKCINCSNCDVTNTHAHRHLRKFKRCQVINIVTSVRLSVADVTRCCDVHGLGHAQLVAGVERVVARERVVVRFGLAQ